MAKEFGKVLVTPYLRAPATTGVFLLLPYSLVENIGSYPSEYDYILPFLILQYDQNRGKASY